MKVHALFKARKVDVVESAVNHARKGFGHIEGASDLALVSHSNACLRHVNERLRCEVAQLKAEIHAIQKGNVNA